MRRLGGIIHTYLGYNPAEFPSPTAPGGAGGDAASAFLDHMMMYGGRRKFTERELAEAIRIDPSQVRGLGPSLEAIRAMLEERKRRILATYEIGGARDAAHAAFADEAAEVSGRPDIPERSANAFSRALSEAQLSDLERLHRRLPGGTALARALMRAIARLRDAYAVDRLSSKYAFTGREAMAVPKAIEVGEELARIDELLRQIDEALKNAKPAIIDMDMLSEFATPESMDDLRDVQRRVNELLRKMAEEAGLERSPEGYRASPSALRTYQKRLLAVIFSDLADGRRGRHEHVHSPDGAIELPSTRPYAFGDSPAHIDVPQSMLNAVARTGKARPSAEDLEVHRTRRSPKCATALILDMSGSMRYGGQYIACKKMALALDALIRSEYPGDILHVIEMYTLARMRRPGEIIELMPKPVSIGDPVVGRRADK